MSSPLTAVLVDSDDDLETYDVERLKTVIFLIMEKL